MNTNKQIRPVILNWLQGVTDILSLQLLHHLDNDTTYGLIVGYIQSGKSRAQLAICMYSVLVKRESVIWIVRNSDADRQQAITNIHSTFGKMSHEQDGWIRYCLRNDIPFDNEYMEYVDNTNSSRSKKTKNEISECLGRGTSNPKVIIAMANNAQLQRLELFIANTDDPVYNLVIDEVDVLGETDNKRTPKRTITFNTLKSEAKNIIGCSATTFNILFGGDVPTEQVYRLSPKPNYVGIPDFDWKPLSQKSVYSSKSDITEDDSEMMEVLSMLEKAPVITARNHKGQLFRHPVLVLNKSSVLKDHHKEFVRKIFGTGWLVISYDADGFLIYHKYLFQNFLSDIIRKNDGKKIAPSLETLDFVGCLHYTGLQIGDVLEHFRKQDELVEKYTHIVIISAKMADRGINYCSNNYRVGINLWHLTHMYYKPAATTDCTAYIQSMRAAGNHNDDIRPVIYTYSYVKEHILKSHRLQDDIIMKVQEEKREIAISDFTYNEMIHDKENLPKKKKLTNRLKINYKLLKVKTTTEGNVNDKREWGLQDLAKNLKNSLENGKNPIYLIILRFFRDYVDGGLENGRTKIGRAHV